MSGTEWIKEHSDKLLVAFIVVVFILMVVLPYVTSSGMADLCVRRPMCASECCPNASGFKSGALSKVREKLRM